MSALGEEIPNAKILKRLTNSKKTKARGSHTYPKIEMSI
jgi:hypothetical protein